MHTERKPKVSLEFFEAAEKLLDLTDVPDIVNILDEMWESYLGDDSGKMKNGDHRIIACRTYRQLRTMITNLET